MRRFIRNILKVSFSNIVSLLSGVLVGFIVPKMMGLSAYGNYKIYTLYLTYLAIFSFGLGDGLYLRFAGTDIEHLDRSQMHAYLVVYYRCLLAFALLSAVCVLLFIPSGERFVYFALSATLVSSQIVAVHQNLSLITLRINEYSTRIIAKSILTSLLVIALFLIFRRTGKEITYQVYIVGVVAIDYFLAAWYLYAYRDFNFCRYKKPERVLAAYRGLLIVGFPLLLSNMAGTIFMNLDRQFVSLLFIKEEYAIYAFAYNMLTLITTMTSAVSVVLFPSMKRRGTVNVAEALPEYLTLFTVLVSFCMIVYFPLCGFVRFYLVKYAGALPILRIVMPGLILSASVSVILCNFYKLENCIPRFFKITITAIVVSALLNYIAFSCYHTYSAISWASIIALLLWYMMSMAFFIRKYRISFIQVSVYTLLVMSIFYIISYFLSGNWFVGGITYFLAVLFVTMIMFKDRIRALVQKYRQ